MHPIEEAVFRALGDSTRRAIFERLTLGEAPVKDLTAHFAVSQPAISQHLATLRGAGLVTERKEGRLVYYRVDPAGLKPLVDWLGHYQSFWVERLGKLHALLAKMEKDR